MISIYNSICFGVRDSVTSVTNGNTVIELGFDAIVYNIRLEGSTTVVFDKTNFGVENQMSNTGFTYIVRVYAPVSGKTITFPSGIKWFVSPPVISNNVVSFPTANKWYYFRIEEYRSFGMFGYYLGCADK